MTTRLMRPGEPTGTFPAPHEPVRCDATPFALARLDALPRAFRVELPSLRVVGEQRFEDRLDLVAHVHVLHRDDDLDAVVEIARHQIGAPHRIRPLVAHLETDEPAVLEDAAED